jgi:GTP-binding protein
MRSITSSAILRISAQPGQVAWKAFTVSTMTRYRSTFLLSATDEAQFPPPNAPEFAFLGRSNVGKSSLINALVGQETARVSSTPGRTRAINFFSLQRSPNGETAMIFADLPGYGYAKVSRSIRAGWPAFVDPYLTRRQSLVLCICLVDLNVPLQAGDLALAEYLDRIGRKRLVVGTKADRLSGNRRVAAINRLRQALGVEEVLPCSVKDGRGMSALWSAIREAAETAAESI